MEREKAIDNNHQILYTSTDKAIIYPSLGEWEMNEKIVSNTYKDGIGRLVFREEITSIPETLFMTCANLRTIEIPPSCRVIHDHAFYCCLCLEKVILNEGLRAIQEYAFSKTKLTKIEIPSSCFIISSYAFAETPLKEVRLRTPSAAYRYIGEYVFNTECRVEGISKYDDFSTTSLGINIDNI